MIRTSIIHFYVWRVGKTASSHFAPRMMVSSRSVAPCWIRLWTTLTFCLGLSVLGCSINDILLFLLLGSRWRTCMPRPARGQRGERSGATCRTRVGNSRSFLHFCFVFLFFCFLFVGFAAKNWKILLCLIRRGDLLSCSQSRGSRRDPPAQRRRSGLGSALRQNRLQVHERPDELHREENLSGQVSAKATPSLPPSLKKNRVH